MKHKENHTKEIQPDTDSEAEAPENTDAEAVSAEKESAGDEFQDPVSGLLEQIGILQKENQTLKERHLRSLAELENYRKRAIREKEEARRFANSTLVGELIPVIDNFELGLKAADGHDGGEVFTKGFEMILSQIKGVLSRNGVAEINPAGEEFDPNLHEAISHHPSAEVAEGRIIAVERIGYTLHQRLIRPASVVVSKGRETVEDPTDQE